MGSSVILPEPGQPTQGPDPNFVSASQPNYVTWNFSGLTPPSPLYIQRDDVLSVRVWNTFVGGIIGVGFRFLDSFTRLLVVGNQLFSLGSTGALTDFDLPLGEGFLFSVQVGAGPLAPVRGQTFISARISRGGGVTRFAPEVLFNDYLDGFHSLGWPGGRIQSPLEGPGFLKTVTQANPAAGADWSTAVPAGRRWRIQSWNAQLAIANAGVARIIRAQVKDSVPNLLWQAAAQQTGAINTTVQVSAAPGQVTSVVDPATLDLALPGTIFLAAGQTFGVSTSNINAGDQWSNIASEVEEWLDTTT